MDGFFSSFWPSNVPSSLWIYDRTIAAPLGSRILPLSNVPIDGEFVLYFLIGLVVVWLYAWNRFNRRSYEPSPFDYRVLRELQPAQMRDSFMMQRAFMLYALALSMIYASFTFFGGIFFKLLKAMPSVGPVDVKDLQSPEYPLILAFGLAGLTQLIGPLDHLEKALRGHIHRSLGIPIRIKEYTRQLIAYQLRKLMANAKGSSLETRIKSLSNDHISTIRPWARNEIAQTYGVDDILAKLILLWRMIDSLYSPLWPQESVRDEMRPLLARQLHEGRAAALYLSELLASPPVREAAGQSDDQQSAKSQGSGSGEPTSDPSLNSDAQPDSQEVYRTRQEQQLITAIESMDRHLYEVAAIHAVYAQRDRNHDRIHNDGLREAIKEIFQEESLGPSLRQLVTCAAVLFIGYCTAITTLNHGMMAAMPVNAWTTGISAAYDTLRTMCVFVFPGLLAIYMTALDPQNELPQPSVVANAMTAALWAGLASLVLMIMVGMTYTWLIARSSEHFQILLFGDIRANGSMQPLLIWFLSYTPISAAIAVGIVLSRSLRWDIGHYLAVFLVALLGATLVVLHGGVLEDRYPACFGQADAPDGRGSSPCWENIVDGLAAKFTDMMAALISILFLSQSGQAGRARTRNSARKNRGTGRRFRRLSRFFKSDKKLTLAAKLILLGLMLVLVAPLYAQTPTAQKEADSSPSEALPKTIVVGFRADADPFSYLNGRGDNSRYRGYVADLCYEIFAGSNQYQISAVPVTVKDRFSRLKPGDGVTEEPLIDLLCDPTTIRYDNPDRWKNGIFSPIVFATGVTYLRRQSENLALPVEVGYVDNTTAKAVAEDMCRNAEREATHKCLLVKRVGTGGLSQWLGAGLFKINLFLQSLREELIEIFNDSSRLSDDNYGIRYYAERLIYKIRAESAVPEKPYFRLKDFKDHGKLMDWFCSNENPAQHFYLGDREVIRSKWERGKGSRGGCELAPGDGLLYTYEPYALLVTKTDPVLVQFVQRRIFQIFSDSSKARAIFAANFPDDRMSSSLAYLFLLNSVDEERAIQRPD